MEFQIFFFLIHEKSSNKYMSLNDISKSNYYSKIKNLFIFMNYILLLHFFNIIFSKNTLLFIPFSSSNKITLKVEKSGTRMVFSSETNYFDTRYYPNIVKINGKTQNVVNHTYYFEQLNNNVELVWYNLIDKSIQMFRACHDINEVDLSSFNTSKIIDMSFMFYNCQFITSINLDNVDTSQVTCMWSMFSYCTRVTSLNLTKFNTSKVESMLYMFYLCKSLTSLDLSNFDTSLVTSMESMFSECKKLEYINMKNFSEFKLEEIEEMFLNVPNNIIICINEKNTKILSNLEDKNCHQIDCTEDWIINQKKIIEDTNQCIEESCSSTEHRYEYINKCYSTCPYGYLENDNSKCKCELEKCLTCSAISLYKNLCT